MNNNKIEQEGQTFSAPMPYFGGKSRIAPEIWKRFGEVPNFVDPFMGSASILLHRPGWTPDKKWTETLNDSDGHVCNFYRAVKEDPTEVAWWANNPPIESDVHARQIYLVNHRTELTERLEGDPEYYDARMAGWWVWGIASFIGGGWCNGEGPWRSVDGKLVHESKTYRERAISRRVMHLGDNGRGVNRRSIHEGHYHEDGVPDKLYALIYGLSNRLSRVRVTCGDWSRVVTKSITTRFGTTGVVLDPPYTTRLTGGAMVYGNDTLGLESAVMEWALQNGDDPSYRIAVCGYEGTYEFPSTWEQVRWKAAGGYSGLGEGMGKEMAAKEMVWFSPHCIKEE